jgi:hypothetical protein
LSKIGAVLDRIEARREADGLEIAHDGTALDLFQAIYRNSALPLHLRMRAARDAIAYESPKLIGVAVSGEKGFAALLDERLRRRAKLIEAKPINGDEGLPSKQHSPEELKLPQSVPDRRFRRRV